MSDRGGKVLLYNILSVSLTFLAENKIENMDERLEKLKQKFNDLKEKTKLLDKKVFESKILFLSKLAYDAGDKDAFKFAEQDLKIINR